MTTYNHWKTDEPTVCIMEFDAATCAAMLEFNTRNRSVRRQRLNILVKQQRAGHYRFTGETIVFDWDGCVADGQHRLMMAVETGLPFTAVLVTGVDPAAGRNRGNGAGRSAADVFAIEGWRNASVLATATKYVEAIEQGVQLASGNVAAITRDELMTRYAVSAVELDAAVSAGRRIANRLGLSEAAWSALAYYVAEADPDIGADFVERLVTGADLSVGSPILAYLAHVSTRRENRGKERYDWPEHVADGIKCWNLWLAGKEVKRWVRWHRGDDWPKASR